MKIIELPSAGSTNTWIASNVATIEAPALVYAVSQTAGRGQRGNSWESEPGMNVTASAFFVPEGVPARCQFSISEAVALAVTDLLDSYGICAKVKWPNDIYVDDRKICGILIEHSLLGSTIMHTIAGIGININQTRFISDTPNPVSLSQLTGDTYDIKECIARLAGCLEKRLAMTGDADALHSEFLSALWRGDGKPYPFFDRLHNQHILARISAIAPDGMLTLTTPEGEDRCFAFKEVEFKL